jgi:two-component system chemotaxis response regulator CheY
MKTLLIVDDSPLYRVLVTQCFQIAGWRVFQAETARSGVDEACHILPGYVITNMELPDGGGMEFVKGVRADVRLQNTKIIALTGKDDPEEREAVLQAGADVCMSRPTEMVAIVSMASELDYRESRLASA